jgi:hypothetical protein
MRKAIPFAFYFLYFAAAAALIPFVVMIALYSLLGSPIVSFSDSATMYMLGDERDKYGRVRLGGTFGWALAAPLAGLLVEHNGIQIRAGQPGAAGAAGATPRRSARQLVDSGLNASIADALAGSVNRRGCRLNTGGSRIRREQIYRRVSFADLYY